MSENITNSTLKKLATFFAEQALVLPEEPCAHKLGQKRVIDLLTYFTGKALTALERHPLIQEEFMPYNSQDAIDFKTMQLLGLRLLGNKHLSQLPLPKDGEVERIVDDFTQSVKSIIAYHDLRAKTAARAESELEDQCRLIGLGVQAVQQFDPDGSLNQSLSDAWEMGDAAEALACAEILSQHECTLQQHHHQAAKSLSHILERFETVIG